MGLNRDLGNIPEVINVSSSGVDINKPVKLSNPIGSAILYGFGSVNDWGLGEDTGQATRDFNLYNYNRASIELSVNRTTGNVGINNTNPSNKLTVVGSSLANIIKWTDTINNTGFLGIRNLGVSIGSDDDLIFETGGTSKMRLYESGNLYIGTSPADAGYKLDVAGTTILRGNTRIDGPSTILQLHSTTGTPQNWWVGQDIAGNGDGIFYIYNQTSRTQALNINKSNKVYIRSHLGVGWTNPAYNLQVLGNCAIGMNTNGTATIEAFNGTAFFGNGGTSTCLGIYNNGNYYFTGSNVSDIRAKDKINNLNIDGIEKVLALRPKSYYMKNDLNKIRYGFIAQDVSEVLPDLISGDLESEEFVGLDYNGIIPVLVKAIQEQQEIIKQLTNRIINLENK